MEWFEAAKHTALMALTYKFASPALDKSIGSFCDRWGIQGIEKESYIVAGRASIPAAFAGYLMGEIINKGHSEYTFKEKAFSSALASAVAFAATKAISLYVRPPKGNQKNTLA